MTSKVSLLSLGTTRQSMALCWLFCLFFPPFYFPSLNITTTWMKDFIPWKRNIASCPISQKVPGYFRFLSHYTTPLYCWLFLENISSFLNTRILIYKSLTPKDLIVLWRVWGLEAWSLRVLGISSYFILLDLQNHL